MSNQELKQSIQNVADAIEYLGDNSIGNTSGPNSYTIADSLETIALVFERWVELQEKIYKEKK